MTRDLSLRPKDSSGGRRGNGLSAYTGPGGGAPDPGASISVADVSFTAKGYTYEADIPTTFRKGAAKAASTALAPRKKQQGRSSALALFDKDAPKTVAPRSAQETAKIEAQVIASGARQLDKPRRSNGRIVQRRIGWQATPTLIVVTTAERELTQSEDGKLRPGGEWEIEHRKTYRNLDGAAQKRVGDVLADDAEPEAPQSPNVHAATPGSGAPPAPEKGSSAPAQDSFPEGTFALSFLPRSVRSSVLARVPNPVVFDGTSLQFSDPQTKKVDRLEVNVIRMDERRAVVVQARRAPGGRHWSVSQATYSLGEPEIEQV